MSGPQIGKCYKVTSCGKYFFGKLLQIDDDRGTYVFRDLRKDYPIVTPIDNSLLEPYESEAV